MGDWSPNAEIIVFQNACFMGYMELKQIDHVKASELFSQYNIFAFIMECYDYLHLSGVEYVVKEIDSRIQEGKKFEERL